jgi:hypothetical protein
MVVYDCGSFLRIIFKALLIWFSTVRTLIPRRPAISWCGFP